MDYKAFISYSHAADGRLAPALQKGLHQFARPWYKMRAMAVFRDETSLAATPELWETIVKALSRSEFFLLMASPASVNSVWVGREIKWWLEHRSIEKLTLVLTDGALVWDEHSMDFDLVNSTSLPEALRGSFSAEPLWVDLSWARRTTDLSLRNSRFRSAILDIAAPLHGRPKDQLDGDDVRQHRRFRQASWAAGSTLAALAVIATLSAYRATLNAEEARRQERIAVSRQLAALSSGLVDRRFDTALLLAVQATRETLTFEAQKSLLSALTTKGTPNAFLYHDSGRVTALAYSRQGTRLAVAYDGASGREILLWNMADKRPTARVQLESGADLVDLAFTYDDAQIHAVDRNGRIFRWVTNSHSADLVAELDHTAKWKPGFSPDGMSLIFAGPAPNQLSTWDAKSGNSVTLNINLDDLSIWTMPTSLASDASRKRIAVGSEGGSGSVWDSSDNQELRRIYIDDEVDIDEIALSSDGDLLAFGGRDGSLFLAPTTGTESTRLPHRSVRLAKMAFSTDDRWLATLDRDGSLILWDLTRDPTESRPVGDRTATTFAFNLKSAALVVGHEDGTVVLWDLAGRAILQAINIGAPHQWVAIAVNHSAERMAAMREDGRIDRLDFTAGAADVATEPWIERHGDVAGMILGDDPDVLILGNSHGDVEFFNTETGNQYASLSLTGTKGDSLRKQEESWDSLLNGKHKAETHPGSKSSRLALSPDGRRLAVETSSGAIALWDLETETVMCTRPERVDPFALLGPLRTVRNNSLQNGCGELPAGSPSHPATLFGEFTGRTRMVFDAQGNLVAENDARGSASLVRIDATSGEQFGRLLASAKPIGAVKSLREYPMEGGALTIGPRRRWLVAGSFGARVRAWDLTMQEPVVRTMEGEIRAATAAAMSPDGRLLAVSDTSGRVVIWDFPTSRRVGELFGGGTLVEIAFDPEGEWLIALTRSGMILTWPIGLNSLQRQACSIAGRNLTQAEWSQLVAIERQCIPICPGQRVACSRPSTSQ